MGSDCRPSWQRWAMPPSSPWSMRWLWDSMDDQHFLVDQRDVEMEHFSGFVWKLGLSNIWWLTKTRHFQSKIAIWTVNMVNGPDRWCFQKLKFPNQSINLSINQSINQPTNQPSKQASKQSINQSISIYIYQYYQLIWLIAVIDGDHARTRRKFQRRLRHP